MVSYCSAYYSVWFTVDGTLANDIAVQIHITCGILVVPLVIARICWRATNVLPAPPPAPRLEQRAARATHLALYGAMPGMPITGYPGTYRDAEYLGITNFGETALFAWVARTSGAAWEAFEAPLDFLHRTVGGSKLVWMLNAIHVTAALYHHFHRRDNTLLRMLRGRWGR